MKFLGKFFFVAALLLSACDSSEASLRAAIHDPNEFIVDPELPKVFMYASYRDESLRPSFDEIFRIQIDKNYYGDIGANQYIQQKLIPGDHYFDIEEIAISGNSVNHATATIHVDGGMPTFIVDTVLPEDKASLTKVEIARGEKDILSRSRPCSC